MRKPEISSRARPLDFLLAHFVESASIVVVNRLPLIGIGATFTMLLLFAPMMALEQWSNEPISAASIVSLSLPLIALGFVFYKGTDWIVYWLFPVSHVPTLLIDERLTTSAFYTGWTGTLGLISVVIVGIAYVAIAAGHSEQKMTTQNVPQYTKVRILQVVSGILSLATLAAFSAATLSGDAKDVPSSSLSIVVGTAVVWFILNGQLWPRIADPWLDPNTLRSAQATTYTTKRPSVKDIWTTSILIVFSLLGILIWIAARGLE